jgi:hypothetical protein
MAGTVLPFITLDVYRYAQARRDIDRRSRIQRAESLGIPPTQLQAWRREQAEEAAHKGRYERRIGWAPDGPRGRLLIPNCWGRNTNSTGGVHV